MADKKTAVIIGAGPAGLTAAYELLKRTKNIHPVVFELTDTIGGISQTVNYKGNRIDIGGHRFFSKNKRVMDWWDEILPKTGDPDLTDSVMLTRNRLSRIYYGRRFYDYPIKLNSTTIKNLGLMRMVKAGFSYLWSTIHKVDEKNLEGFYVNRFGRELYNTFFRDYTEKLWGVKPSEIDSSWGAQRVKGLSVAKVLANALGLSKEKETSLIDTFYYPKYGPGYLWEKVAGDIEKMGGEVHKNHKVIGVNMKGDRPVSVEVLNEKGKKMTIDADYVFSTLPIPELVNDLKGIKVPDAVKEISDGLVFRDFITVGILASELKTDTPDNWIYIQEPDVTVCRLQIFNNWSPYMTAGRMHKWIGMEYVVSEKDAIWKYDDRKMADFGIKELEKIGMLDKSKVVDYTVVHIKKAYPAYFGTYDRFGEVREYLESFKNLYCLGRNGQHRYNNMDHSMLTAMEAVDNIIKGKEGSDNVWNVNTEKDYHESK